MTRDKLQDQLEKLRALWNTKTQERIVIPKKSHIPRIKCKRTSQNVNETEIYEMLRGNIALLVCFWASVHQFICVDVCKRYSTAIS
jgi:hypothetical protein